MGNGHRFRRTATGLATGLAVIASLLVAGGGTANAAPAVVLDGSTAALAAPSCWSIKQNVPAAADGTYFDPVFRVQSSENKTRLPLPAVHADCKPSPGHGAGDPARSAGGRCRPGNPPGN